LGALYDRYGQMAYSLFVRVTRDEGAAEDLVQELFLRVWNRVRQFDPARGGLGVWVLSIARNMAVDHTRSAAARFSTRTQPIELTDQLCYSYRASEPESVIDRARMVKEAFEKLTSNQQRVLELAYFEGCSQTEIAAQLHEPLGTVKTWMRSGLERMRTVVKSGVTK
jgi:RNA polymerase sigma-70 factor, ECF subfamily